MTQLDPLTKHNVGSPSKVVNVVDFKSVNCYETEQEVSLDDKIRFLSNPFEGSHPTNQRQGENQGLMEEDHERDNKIGLER